MNERVPVTVIGAGGVAVRARAPLGERLLDVLDEAHAPVPFGCRDARCGTCLVEVLAGAGCLASPGPSEQEVVEAMGSNTSTHRLACQVRIIRAGERIRLQAHRPADRGGA